MKVPLFSQADLTAKHEELRRPWHSNYLAMFSSVFGGIVTDPILMTIPIDDHLVHRADGVFDLFKSVNGRAYCQERHLARLENSAAGLDLKMPADYTRIREIIKAVAQVGGVKDCLIRIIVSRGPGGFSTNPYECPASQLYVVISRLQPLAKEKYEKGIPIISAPVPVKPSTFANIKSADYLGNVLVKKAAVESGVEYAVNWDENGYLAEGSTENILLVSPDKELLIPSYERVLKGVTMTRVIELAERLIDKRILKGVKTAYIDHELAARCPEVMLSGTTLDILPVNRWDGRQVGGGVPGPVAKTLLELIRKDITENEELLTPLFDE